jgi:hypothetical protein
MILYKCLFADKVMMIPSSMRYIIYSKSSYTVTPSYMIAHVSSNIQFDRDKEFLISMINFLRYFCKRVLLLGYFYRTHQNQMILEM